LSVVNFIPEVWIARLLFNIHNALVFAQPSIVNRDYEGEIQQAGDTVRVSSIGPVTISDYVRNTDMAQPEELTDAQSTIVIDQAKYFNFHVDDVDALQAQPELMNAAMQQAAYGLAATIDKYIAALYTDAAGSVGTAGAPVAPTNTTAYEYLVDLSVKLDEQNAPEVGRWAVVPPWYEGLLLKDARFVQSGQGGSEDRLRNGMIGRAAGFDILKSNNVSSTGVGSGSTYRILGGVNNGITLAEQMRKVEAYRPERRFADAIKGLHLWGAKTLFPQFLAVLYANRP